MSATIIAFKPSRQPKRPTRTFRGGGASNRSDISTGVAGAIGLSPAQKWRKTSWAKRRGMPRSTRW
jgi:hypothetical protein